ncbi:MAG: ABC transporter substrate-binding protein, partial [Atopobium sp.]|nr:ABC transporter substrate-binding protein [Atopobium sp.]
LYDGDGNEFEAKFDKAPESVVTLTDSAAEILLRLGLGSKIIGTIKPDAPMPSDIADEYAKIKQLGDKKSLSREVVVAANPNLIVGRSRLFTSKDQTSPKDYADLGISVYTQLASSEQGDPTLAGIISDIKNLGSIFDVQSNADTYTADLQKRLDAINERVKAHEKDAKKTV